MTNDLKIFFELNEKPMTKEELNAQFIENMKKSYRLTMKTIADAHKELSATEQLHLNAAAYATYRKNLYLEAMKEDIAIKRTLEQMQGIWLAHYEGYREGYWVATGNEFATDPAKLKEKDNG